MRGLIMLVLGIALVSPAALAADKDFNGKWDLILHKTPADHAWWMEISGAGTDMVRGTFLGFPDGLNPILDARIQDGVLHFSYDRPASQGKRGAISALRVNYQFHYVDGKLEGSMSGDTRGNWTFTGERAPAINEHDDGTWVIRGKPVVLFDGKDLAGWSGITSGTRDGGHGWSVADGVLTTKGRAGHNGENIATRQKFWNFELHAEYRVVDPSSNSGIGLRGRYEVQIGADFWPPRARRPRYGCALPPHSAERERQQADRRMEHVRDPPGGPRSDDRPQRPPALRAGPHRWHDRQPPLRSIRGPARPHRIAGGSRRGAIPEHCRDAADEKRQVIRRKAPDTAPEPLTGAGVPLEEAALKIQNRGCDGIHPTRRRKDGRREQTETTRARKTGNGQQAWFPEDEPDGRTRRGSGAGWRHRHHR